MSSEQCDILIAEMRKHREILEGVAAELANFVAYIRERDSYPRTVYVENRERRF